MFCENLEQKLNQI